MPSSEEDERKRQHRAARDKQLDDIEKSLKRATDLIGDSQREIQRSRDLMQNARDRNQQDDAAEDKREG